MIVVGIIVGIIILVLLVVAHELGHGIVARRNGVVVEEFGVGFPPKAWGRKVAKSILGKHVLFSVNWLPLGGFVKLQGEHDSAKGKGDYGAASFWVKTKILLAGVLMNWAVAAVILTVLAVTGLPKVIPDQFTIASDTTIMRKPVQVTQIASGYPAERAGLQKNDQIKQFAGSQIETSEQLVALTKIHKGEAVPVVYLRDGVEHHVTVTLRDSSGAVFGAGFGQQELTRSTWSAPIVGVVATGQLSLATIQGVGDLLANLGKGLASQFSANDEVRKEGGESIAAAGDSVAGPIGILGSIFPAAQQAGLTQLLLLTAIISLTLAVMNILPIPALDGGRWFTMAVFRIIRQPLTKNREENIQAIGFLVLMALIVLVTVKDVTRLFS